MESRTKNSVLNSLIGIFSYAIVFMTTFVVRKFFAVYLGQEILGINSLFTNIITFLSMAELGLSAAMVIFLYKPVANKDEQLIKAYMQFYKHVYRFIFLFVFILGLIIMIFIPHITNSTYSDTLIRWYFMLFVLNTCTTYTLAYKKSILYADQKNRIVSVVHAITRVIFLIIQVGVLIITKNFTIYLVSVIVSNLVENIICNYYADLAFPCLKHKNVAKLKQSQIKEIISVVKPLFIQRIANTFLTSSDNILVSIFVNLKYVAIYSNYILISQTVISLLSQIFAAFTSSFGNLTVCKEKSESLNVLLRVIKISHFLTLNICLLYLVNIQDFIHIWLGNVYVADFQLPILVTICLFFNLSNYPLISAQNAIGYHKYDYKASIYQVIFNITASLALTYICGVNGVVLGTIFSILFFPTITKPIVIYKRYYCIGVKKHFRMFILQSIQFFLMLLIAILIMRIQNPFIIQNTLLMNLMTMMIKSLCIFIIINGSFLIFDRNTLFVVLKMILRRIKRQMK